MGDASLGAKERDKRGLPSLEQHTSIAPTVRKLWKPMLRGRVTRRRLSYEAEYECSDCCIDVAEQWRHWKPVLRSRMVGIFPLRTELVLAEERHLSSQMIEDW
jgi:hypothetical protein